MTSITSKEGRMRSKTIFLCHCKRAFPTETQLCNHTQIQHNQEVLALEGYITITSTVHRIIRSQACHSPTPQQHTHSHQGHQDCPIQILDSPLQQLQTHIPEKIHPELMMEMEEGEVEGGEEGEGGEGVQVASRDVEKGRRMGRRPNFLIKVLKVPDVAMERCSSLLGRFISSQWAKQLAGLDFRQLMAGANQSKLCNQLCRFIAGWPIAHQDFTQDSFRTTRDRLLVLSLLPLGEQAFLKWRGMKSLDVGEHADLFNFFFLEFVPTLMRQKKMTVWIRKNQASVLLNRKTIHSEVMAFLRWWNHQLPLFAVHPHPAHDFTPLLTQQTPFQPPLTPIHPMEEEDERSDSD